MKSGSSNETSFVQRIQAWQQQSGRHYLPWQGTRDPYRVWLSEIMLQQTQVSTVIPYYERFLSRFPSVTALAQADQDEVLSYWAGLGYYARARNLHRCAQLVVELFAGVFPSTPEQLEQLPGIGKSTANAIAAFCFGTCTPIMDGNVKRVFTRFFGITGYGTATDKKLWQLAYDEVKGESHIGRYNQGLMDLGSMICTRTKPCCMRCPLQQDCYANIHHLQHEFPSKKPKKVIPQRETFMLIVQHKHHLLLQKRPSQGIWGGLLSLPELSTQQEVDSWLAQRPYLQAKKMASFEHIFSHYRLLIHPVLVTFLPTSHETLLAESDFPQAAWYDYRQQLALPSPVAKIITGLIEEADSLLF